MGVFIALQIPMIIVITKTDIANLSAIKQRLKNVFKGLAYKCDYITNSDSPKLLQKIAKSMQYTQIPIFSVSNVTHDGIV